MPELEPFQRKELADAIRRARVRDRESFANELGSDFYISDRGFDAYIDQLSGLQNFLDFVRGVGGSSTILDVGAGTTQGAADLVRSSFTKGLDVKATALFYTPAIESHLGIKNTKITPVEILRGIENQSVAGVIGVHSIAYARYPRLAVEAIDRVLVSGGAVKASFERFNNDNGMKDERMFKLYFRKLKYDIATIGTSVHTVMVAIKPGSNQQVSAEDLIRRDNDTWLDQQAFVARERGSLLAVEAV